MRYLLPVLLFLCIAPFARAQSPFIVLPANNIVVNGGFESGIAGWQGTYGVLNPIQSGGSVPALEGNNVGFIIDVAGSSVGQPMWQTLNTTPGQHYFFTFSMLSGYGLVGEQSTGNTGAPVNVYWGGDFFGSGGEYLGVFRNTSTTTWQTSGFDVVANSSSTTISFIDYTDTHYQLIDAISVTPVPEPAAPSMIMGGLILLGLLRFWHRLSPSTSLPQSYSAGGR